MLIEQGGALVQLLDMYVTSQAGWRETSFCYSMIIMRPTLYLACIFNTIFIGNILLEHLRFVLCN